MEIVIDQIRSGNTDPLNILKALFGKDVALVFTDPFIHDAFNTIDHIIDLILNMLLYFLILITLKI